MKKFTKIGLTIWLASVGLLGALYLLGLLVENMELNIGSVKRLKGDTLLCFDVSGSMLDVLEDYSSELEFFLRIVPPAARMGLRTFGLKDRPTKLQVPVSPRSRRKIREWLKGEKQEAGGGTPMAEALNSSIEDFPSDAKQKNLLLITDGEPNNFDETCEAAKLAKEKDIIIRYILVAEEQQNIENLEKIVSQCGKGEVIVVKARDFGHLLQMSFGNYLFFLIILLIAILTVYASYHQARFLSHILPIYLPGKLSLTVVPRISLVFWIAFTLVVLTGLFHVVGWKLGTILMAASVVAIVVIGLMKRRL